MKLLSKSYIVNIILLFLESIYISGALSHFSLDISIKNLNRKWNLSVVVSNPPRKNIKLFPLIGHPSGILVRLKRTQKGNSTPYQWWFLKSTLIFITWILIHGNIWGHCNSKLDWLIATRRTTVGRFSLWILHTIQPVLSTWHLPAPSPRGLMHVGAQHSPTGGCPVILFRTFYPWSSAAMRGFVIAPSISFLF